MTEDLSLDDLGVIPVPEEQQKSPLQDKFDYDVAYNLAFVGVGQGGSRLAETFGRLGYARACAINTTHQDLEHIKLEDHQKLDLGGSGAGKDPQIGATAVSGREEDVYDLFKRCWGSEADIGIVCLGAGGGTGAGAYPIVAEVARKFLEEHRGPENARVGVMVAMPQASEGQRPTKNMLTVMQQLMGSTYSPVIVLDNDRIEQLYPGHAINKFYTIANNSVASLLHLFNRLAAQPSEQTTFDRADLAKLFDSGVVAFGAQKIQKHDDEADISTAIRQNLRNNILAAVDLTKGTQAGLIFVVGRELYETLPKVMLEHGFTCLTRILKPDSTVYRGVYPGQGGDLHAFTMIGGLPFPVERMRELARRANITSSELESWLGL